MPDATEVEEFLRNQAFDRALPSSLPDQWLEKLCDDLRKFLKVVKTNKPSPELSERENFMASPLLFVVHILDARSVAASIPEVAYGMNDFPELFRRYLSLCEQEIAMRAGSERSFEGVETFLAYVDRKVRRDAVR